MIARPGRSFKPQMSFFLGGRPVRSRDQFEQVAVGAIEIDAAAAVEVVDLAGPLTAEIRVVRNARAADAGQSGVELRLGHQESVVLGVKIGGVPVVERDPVARADRYELAPL